MSNGIAYTHITAATSSMYGVIKLDYAGSNLDTNHAHLYGSAEYASGVKSFLSCGLETNQDGHGRIFIPHADDSRLGLVKTKQEHLSYDTNAMLSYVSLDDNKHAYVRIPYAHYENDAAIPGVLKTGMPDTTSVQVVRNVYLDNDGFACVNVVN